MGASLSQKLEAASGGDISTPCQGEADELSSLPRLGLSHRRTYSEGCHSWDLDKTSQLSTARVARGRRSLVSFRSSQGSRWGMDVCQSRHAGAGGYTLNLTLVGIAIVAQKAKACFTSLPCGPSTRATTGKSKLIGVLGPGDHHVWKPLKRTRPAQSRWKHHVGCRCG